MAADKLTVREREIAEAFSLGETHRELGERLGVSPNTVRRHLSNIYEKLGIASKAELESDALGRALITESPLGKPRGLAGRAGQDYAASMRSRMLLAMTVLFAGPLGCGSEPAPVAPSVAPVAVAVPPAPVADRTAPIEPNGGAGAGGVVAGGAVATAPISNADVVIAGLRGKFRVCYQAGVGEDPKMEGKVVVSSKVAADGTVDTADVASVEGLSPRVTTCIADAIKHAQFSPPGGKGSTLQIPVKFVQDQSKNAPPPKPKSPKTEPGY